MVFCMLLLFCKQNVASSIRVNENIRGGAYFHNGRQNGNKNTLREKVIRLQFYKQHIRRLETC